MYFESGLRVRKSVFENRFTDPIYYSKSFENGEAANFVKRKVDDEISAVFAMSVGEDISNVGYLVQVVVMQNDNSIVLCHDQILLDIVCALRKGDRLRGECVFRQITARASMGDDYFSTVLGCTGIR